MPPRFDLGELGRTGLSRVGGTITEEILPELRGLRWRQVLREMANNDPTIGAVLFAIEMLVRQVTWTVEPATEASADVDLATFVEGALVEDMEVSWQDTLSEILTFLPWGWALLETNFKVRAGDNPRDPTMHSRFDDGRVGWRSWSIRGQESLWQWVFDPDTQELLAMQQQPAPDYMLRTIPLEKALLFRTTTRKGNPEGHSILRSAYTSWYYRTNISRIEAIGIERDLAGLPIAWGPAELFSINATAEDAAIKTKLEEIVTNIRRDEAAGLAFPLAYDESGHKLYDLTLLSTGGQRQIDTNQVVDRYDQRILMSVMADFMMLGQRSVGSFALSSNKTELFGVALGAWLDSICQEINRTAIPRLLRLNGLRSDQGWPTLVHGDIETADLGELGEYLKALGAVGFPLFPNTKLEDHLLSVADLPELTEEDRAMQDAERQQEAAALAQQMQQQQQQPEPVDQRQNGQQQPAEQVPA